MSPWFGVLAVLLVVGVVSFLWFRITMINQPRRVFRGGIGDSERGRTGHSDLYADENAGQEPETIVDESHPSQNVAPGEIGEGIGRPPSESPYGPPPGTKDDYAPPPPEPPGGFLRQVPKPSKRLPEADIPEGGFLPQRPPAGEPDEPDEPGEKGDSRG
ncbi:hypothetical protein CLV63_110132 [Murinocardiopsis flavida]|uniref:Uncharacterized protein n=1 Tax=Murinocardiopsis flavida TaxID=645275 RepID=A0A2P8DHY9_9ACTN|nr:hypothetical protein [Murinocardiopsis flavida]PSK96835.1 hypothetical protein CLV63_110132 [Murinocardiopsis flavida]